MSQQDGNTSEDQRTEMLIWTPISNADIARRWFSWPNSGFLSPVPIITALIAVGEWYALRQRQQDLMPFLGAIGLFLMSFIGIAISLWPMLVPYHYTLWDAASSASTQAFMQTGHPVMQRRRAKLQRR